MEYFRNALSLFPSHIYFHCGHRIEATVADIENLDDGVDLSLCRACREAEEEQFRQEAKLSQEKKKAKYYSHGRINE